MYIVQNDLPSIVKEKCVFYIKYNKEIVNNIKKSVNFLKYLRSQLDNFIIMYNNYFDIISQSPNLIKM